MSEPQSEADKIRNKRLAKLGNPQPSQAQVEGASAPSASAKRQSPTSSGPSSPHAANAEKPPSWPNSTPQATTASQPLKLGIRDVTSPPRPNKSPEPVAQVIPAKKARIDSPADQSLDVWEDSTLSEVFRLSLDPGKKKDYHGHKLTYVPGVRQELEEQEAPLKMNVDFLEQAILEAASIQGKVSPLEYLLACWKRVSRLWKNLRSKGQEPKVEIVRTARRLCMSYSIFTITMPEMFNQEPSLTNELTSHLLVDQEDDRGLCHDFLSEIVSRFEEDESAREAMVGAVEQLSIQMRKMTMNDDFKPYVLALRNLVRYPAMANAIVQSDLFLPPDIDASNFEFGTLMGPFFMMSPLQGPVTQNYFSAPKTRDRGYILNSQNALRLTLRAHQTELLDITNYIIKTSKESREGMLDWLARSLNLNQKRRALQVDKKTVSSDGFMNNVTTCLDQLCEPFMDATFSKLDRIDVEYLRRRPRIDIREETKLNADQKKSDEFYSHKASGESNFISEVFFLTLAAHHYGTEATNQILIRMERELKHMEREVERLEADRPKFASNPQQLALFERAVQKYKDKIDQGLAYKLSVQAVLRDDLTQTRSMQFMRYVIVWMLKLVSPSQSFPKTPLKLPLPESQLEVFFCLPEYFLEDVVANFKFIMRNMPQIITSTQSEEIVMFCITFLRSSSYIKNPYLKADLTTILFHGTWPVYGRQKGVLGDLLNSYPFALSYLLHTLMNFYIEVEVTGTHTQFFDKFNIRFEIFQIIKCIWSNPVYRDQLSQEAAANVEFFVRFVNLLLNDVTFVLDESLTAFTQIHDLTKLLASPPPDMTPEVKTEKEEALEGAKGRAKSYMQLTNETVAMLKLFTEALADSFTMPEIVQRLADMLDYNLDTMVGPKSLNLKVENAQEYNFNPRTLLSEIADVYLNLRNKENFVFAVARDGRSYKDGTIEQAGKLLRQLNLKSPEELKRWEELRERFRRAKEADVQAEEDLGDIPDEFLDPLMYTLMEDPVILPTSKNIIDRSTIRSHLLSDPNDPFNRVPLKIEEVIPATELKAKIEAFKAERKGDRLANANVMDTSAG